MGCPSPTIHPLVTAATIPLRVICFYCGCERIAVADPYGRLKTCPGCGAQLARVTQTAGPRRA